MSALVNLFESALIMVGVICALTGLFVIGYFINDTWLGHADRHANKQRNTAIDDVVVSIIRMMLDETTRDQWYTGVDASSCYGQEYIGREAGGIKITGLGLGTDRERREHLQLKIEGVGKFNGSEIKPAVVDDLLKACEDFKRFRSVEAILHPDRIRLQRNENNQQIAVSSRS